MINLLSMPEGEILKISIFKFLDPVIGGNMIRDNVLDSFKLYIIRKNTKINELLKKIQLRDYKIKDKIRAGKSIIMKYKHLT